MRSRAAALAALFLASAPLPATAWDSFSYPDAKFAIQFPAPPKIANGTWRTDTGLDVPARIYAVRAEGVDYGLTIADFTGAAFDHDSAIKDAVALVSKRGEVKIDVDARINRQYGRELSVIGKDGARSILAIFFFGDRLYVLDGRAYPPDAAGASASLIHFQQSLQFSED